MNNDIADWKDPSGWRRHMAERIAGQIDPERFGVANVYLIGSVKNDNAGTGSDIDLLLHFRGTPEQLESLKIWLEGWSRCLAEINYLKTGYLSDGLLDVHIVTDEAIAQKTSFAVKIGAASDAALPLPMAFRS